MDQNKKHIKNVFDFSSAAYRDKVLPLIEDQINKWLIKEILKIKGVEGTSRAGIK